MKPARSSAHPAVNVPLLVCVRVLVLVLALVATALTACTPQRAAPPLPMPASATAPGQRDNDSDAALLTEGRRWVSAFFDGSDDALWNRFDEAMKEHVGSKEALSAFRSDVQTSFGKETRVLDERIDRSHGKPTYVRAAAFQRIAPTAKLWIGFDEDGRIGAFGVLAKPAAEAATDKLAYRTQADLHLPFRGTWFVGWGGRSLAENQHAAVRAQRFACDFFVSDDAGRPFRSDGHDNRDYLDYGLEILAPAAGRVANIIDGIAENVPGQPDPHHPTGNAVVIDHGHGEFSVLAHLVPGSISVKPGDTVQQGQVIGRCGNSGNSTMPHLHYHLQNTPRLDDLTSTDGLPAQFIDYVANGASVERGEPHKNQKIHAVDTTRPH